MQTFGSLNFLLVNCSPTEYMGTGAFSILQTVGGRSPLVSVDKAILRKGNVLYSV